MKRFYSLLTLGFISTVVLPVLAFAQDPATHRDIPESTGGFAGPVSPFTDYTASAITYVLIAGVLITVLLVGAFLVLNLGLMSKREEDKIGKRDPSDVGILKSSTWPPEADIPRVLPAEEEDFDLQSDQPRKKKDVA